MMIFPKSGVTEIHPGRFRSVRRAAQAAALVFLLAVPCMAADFGLLDSTKESAEGWNDKFGDVPSGATLSFSGGSWIVSGTNAQDVWGRIYRELDVDLSQNPRLELEVGSLTRQGYVVIVSEQISGGYQRIADIAEPGTVRVDLAEKTGLKGKQHIRLELGVTDDGAGSNLNAKMVITRMRLITQGGSEDRKADTRKVLKRTLYSNAERDTSLFNDHWGDAPSGAAFSVLKNGNLAVTGTKKTDVWGCVFVQMPAAFDSPSELLITVEKIAGEGYLILKHPSLPDGFVRLEPAPAIKGVCRSALPAIQGGDQPAELQVGVMNPQGPDATGASIEISKIEIWGPGSESVDDNRKISALALLSPDKLDEQAAEFQNKWGDLSSGASFAVRNGAFVVTGTRKDDVYGCVYRNVDIDLDEDPILNIDVRKAKGEGYIILKADGLPDGYVRLAPPLAKAGKFRYVLSDFIRKREKLSVELQIGVVNSAGPNAIGAEIAISSLTIETKKKVN